MKKCAVPIFTALALCLSLLSVPALASDESYQEAGSVSADLTTITQHASYNVDGVTYTYDGDASSGLNLKTAPGGPTYYLAGSGCILFTPATDEANARLTLQNATLTGSLDVQLEEPLTIELVGSSKILVINDEAPAIGLSIGSDAVDSVTTICGDGSLDITARSEKYYTAMIFASNDLTIASGRVTSPSQAGVIIGTRDTFTVGEDAQVSFPFVAYLEEATIQGYTGPLVQLSLTKADSQDSSLSLTVTGSGSLNGTLFRFFSQNYTDISKLTVDSGVSLTIPDTMTLRVGAVENNGTIVNNGALFLPSTTQIADIQALNLQGSGVVGHAGTDGHKYELYDNSGTSLLQPDILEESKEHGNLDHNGYYWDESTRTLTLRNVNISDDGNELKIPDSITIVVEGEAVIYAQLDCQGSLTIVGKGGKLMAKSIVSETGGTLTLQDATVDVYSLSWNGSGGVALGNSALNLTADSELTKLSLDDSSVVNCVYGLHSQNADAFTGCLPTGYTAGGLTGGAATYVLDADGLQAQDFSLRKQTGQPTVRPSTPSLPSGTDQSQKPADPDPTNTPELPSPSDTPDQPSDNTDNNTENNTGGNTGNSTGGGNSSGNTTPDPTNTPELPSPSDTPDQPSDNTDNSSGGTGNNTGGGSTGGSSTGGNTTGGSSNRGNTTGGSSGNTTTSRITVRPQTGGSVKASPTSAASGQTVELTVTADEGYELESLTVQDSKGSELPLAETNEGYSFQMPDTEVTISAEFSPLESAHVCPSEAYSDVDTGKWYHEAIDYALEKGLMTGYGDGRFGPTDTLSRAMLVQILYNQAGRPETEAALDFIDVSETAWYADALRWAVCQGAVEGYGNGCFGPNDQVTREQLTVMLWRCTGSAAASQTELDFTDADQVSAYARQALLWANEEGIVSGKGNGRLDPKGQASRAEIAQMMMNLMEQTAD